MRSQKPRDPFIPIVPVNMEPVPGFTFDRDTHTGRMNGEVWPSVTQLLQQFKLIDYSGVPSDVLEKKRILGTRVHFATVLMDNQDLDEEDTKANMPEILPYLEAYRNFRIMEHFEPAHIKTGRLVSTKWKFHGEPDEHGVRFMKYGPENYLVDYKCTFKMFNSTGAQLAAYSMLFAECLKIKINKRFGLLLKPNGKFDLVPFAGTDDKMDFQSCLWLHWQLRNKYK